MYRMSARLDGNRGKMGATAGQHGDTQSLRMNACHFCLSENGQAQTFMALR
jgi:hypothetical protein